MNAKTGICTLADAQAWEALHSRLGRQAPPFFGPNYHRALDPAGTETECFWSSKDENNFLYYPYLKKSLNGFGYNLDDEYCDISGAYGYNGPLGRVRDPGFVEAFNHALLDYFAQIRAVTEFVRYCPLTNNRRFHLYSQQVDVLDNVYIDLSPGQDWVWKHSFEHRARKAIRNGEGHGLKTVIHRGSEIVPEEIEVLHEIYTSTMQRNEADEFFFFDRSFFESLVANLGHQSLLALSYYEDNAISAELLLLGGTLAYGFLGGTLSEYYQYKANSFQRWELVKYLCEHGFEKYSLGASSARGDGIYKFKMSFARGCANPFYIGTKVHLPEVYAQLRSQWLKMYPEAAKLHANKIQGYRIRF